MLCPARPQFGITFPSSYLNNVCHVFSLQLYKVSKNLHTLGSSIRIMYNYRMTFTTFRNWFCSVSLLHIVFPDFYNSAKNQWSKWSFLFNILYLIFPLEIPKKVKKLIILSGFLNMFLVKNEVVNAVRLVVITRFNKFIPLYWWLGHIWLVYWVTAKSWSRHSRLLSGRFLAQLTPTTVLSTPGRWATVWRREQKIATFIKEQGMRKMKKYVWFLESFKFVLSVYDKLCSIKNWSNIKRFP